VYQRLIDKWIRKVLDDDNKVWCGGAVGTIGEYMYWCHGNYENTDHRHMSRYHVDTGDATHVGLASMNDNHHSPVYTVLNDRFYIACKCTYLYISISLNR
jgi:hypothetical protein